MRHCLFPLLAAMTLTASIARAELEYVAYDLDTKSGTVLPKAPANIHEDTWHSPTNILFVRDPSVSTYYIGVFELTKGQAEILGFKDPAADTKPLEQAFAQQASSAVTWTIPKDHPLLRFPTVSEWQAYADEASQEQPCNIKNGLKDFTHIVYEEPSRWWVDGLGKSAKANIHGVVDIFGNVAEYTSDKGAFYGGWASSKSEAGDFDTLSTVRENGKSPNQINESNGRLGIRLVYMPPAEVRYTAKVMLGGKVVGESQQAKEGEPVMLRWPQPTAGHRRITRTVTPESLSVKDDFDFSTTTFLMPASDVTLAFEEKAIATVAVTVEGEGGTVAFARKEPWESFDTLPENEAYVGETLTLTATPEASWKVKEWRDAEGAPIAEAGTKTTWDYAIPEGTKAGTSLAFTVVFERPEYEVNVTLDGVSVEGWPKRFAEGELVSVEPPTPTKPGYRLFKGPKELKPFTFNMPAESQTFAYTSKAYVNVVVQGNGSVSDASPFVGDQITLEAKAPKYRVFKQWTGAKSSTENPLTYTIPTGREPGSTLTFTAEYDLLPRVLVTGGSARVTQGTPHGEGYYSIDAQLTLTAETAPKGYKFSKWVSSGEGGVLSGDTFTVNKALRNKTVILTAEYIADDEHPSENPAVTHIGVDADGSGTQTAVTLGWEADKTTEYDLLGNTFVFHSTKEPEAAYAVLDLTEKTTSYAETVENAETNKVQRLVLKRIRPTAGTHYDSGDTYYVGIYETTVGHFKTLFTTLYGAEGTQKLSSSALKKSDTHPYVLNPNENANLFMDALGQAFGLTAKRPTVVQIENITKAGLKSSEAYNGAGYCDPNNRYGDYYIDDKDIFHQRVTGEMIVYEGNGGYWDSIRPVGTKKPDPYGFYDLWGNAIEWLSDKQGQGGYAGLGADALTNYPRAFNLNYKAVTGGSAEGTGAVRPAVVVPEKVKVWIKDGLSGEKIGPFEVLPGQVVRLAAQVRAGYDFAGWEASVGTLTEESGQWVSSGITEDVTFTATYTKKVPLSLSYEGCIGPATALPGQTITVYAESPTGAPMTTLEIAPDGSGTCETKGTEGTVTFSATATGKITITAEYEVPKSGYRLRLR